MKFSTTAVASLAVGAATAAYSAPSNGTVARYTTQVVTAYTTYCPGPTSIVLNSKTYTITKATTFTITDCPCTLTKPVFSAPATYTGAVASGKPAVASGGSVTSGKPGKPAVASGGSVAGGVPVASGVPVGSSKNGTASGSGSPVVPGSPPSYTGSYVSPSISKPAQFTGAANKAVAASGAGLAAVFGFAAYIL